MVLLLGIILPFLGIKNALVLVILGAVVTYFWYKIKEKQNFWQLKGVTHIKPKFFFGSFNLKQNKSLTEKTVELYNAFPDERYNGFYQFTTPILLIKDPDLIKLITVKAFDHFTDHRDLIGEDIDPFWSRNLFVRNGKKWRDLRNALTPSFTSSKLKIMHHLIQESSKDFVNFFLEKKEEIIEIEAKETICRYTNDVIATTAFGVKCNSLKNSQNEFYQLGKKAVDFSGLKLLKISLAMMSPFMARIFQVRVIPQKVADYFSQIITNTVKIRQENNIVRPDMIHPLLEAQKTQIDITTDDIISQAFVFFLAGFETVATFLSFVFYELALNSDIQEKLREELQDSDDDITYDKLLEMKYLDMVTLETLRKWPPAVLSDRKVTKAFTIPPENLHEKSVDLPKDLICWIPIYALHRDPKYFPNPEKFDPDRFKNAIPQNFYLPFGAGPRSCIGSRFALLEGKLLIYHILKHFQIIPIAKTPIPVEFDKKQINISVKNGVWLGLKKIKIRSNS